MSKQAADKKVEGGYRSPFLANRRMGMRADGTKEEDETEDDFKVRKTLFGTQASTVSARRKAELLVDKQPVAAVVSRDAKSGVIEWLETIPPELWQMMTQYAGAGQFNPRWVAYFSRLSRYANYLTKSEALWRYMYECMLLAPTVDANTSAFSTIVTLTGDSQPGAERRNREIYLREEVNIHFELMRPYVWALGKMLDDSGAADDPVQHYRVPDDLPHWKVWKRMVEVLSRRHTMISALPAPYHYGLQADKGHYVDPSRHDGYYAARTDTAATGVTYGIGSTEIPTNTTTAHLDRSDARTQATEVINRHNIGSTPRDYEANSHQRRLELAEHNFSSHTVDGCPWPLAISNERVQLLLPTDISVGCALPHAFSDNSLTKAVLAYTTLAGSGHLILVMLGRDRPVPRGGGGGGRRAAEVDPVILMHRINLPLLIWRGILEMRRISDHPSVRTEGSTNVRDVPEAYMGEPRVLFTTNVLSTYHQAFPSEMPTQYTSNSPSFGPYRQYPMAHLFADKCCIPAGVAISRNRLVLAFHQGLQSFQWDAPRVESLVADDFFAFSTIRADMFNGSRVRNTVNFTDDLRDVDGPNPLEENDETDGDLYVTAVQQVQSSSITEVVSDITQNLHPYHATQATAEQPIRLVLTEGFSIPHPAHTSTAMAANMGFADYVEVKIDPLGGDRLVLLLGLYTRGAPDARAVNITTRQANIDQAADEEEALLQEQYDWIKSALKDIDEMKKQTRAWYTEGYIYNLEDTQERMRLLDILKFCYMDRKKFIEYGEDEGIGHFHRHNIELLEYPIVYSVLGVHLGRTTKSTTLTLAMQQRNKDLSFWIPLANRFLRSTIDGVAVAIPVHALHYLNDRERQQFTAAEHHTYTTHSDQKLRLLYQGTEFDYAYGATTQQYSFIVSWDDVQTTLRVESSKRKKTSTADVMVVVNGEEEHQTMRCLAAIRQQVSSYSMRLMQNWTYLMGGVRLIGDMAVDPIEERNLMGYTRVLEPFTLRYLFDMPARGGWAVQNKVPGRNKATTVSIARELRLSMIGHTMNLSMPPATTSYNLAPTKLVLFAGGNVLHTLIIIDDERFPEQYWNEDETNPETTKIYIDSVANLSTYELGPHLDGDVYNHTESVRDPNNAGSVRVVPNGMLSSEPLLRNALGAWLMGRSLSWRHSQQRPDD